MLRISYPHYTSECGIKGASFYNRAGWLLSNWIEVGRIPCYLRVSTPLRGFVPKLRVGLRSLIWGLRILEGQRFSVNEARELNLEPGRPALKKAGIKRAHSL